MTRRHTTPRAQRGGGRGAPARFDRAGLIDRLTRSDGGLEDILAKGPRDLTEAEIRRVAEHRLALPAGDEKEALDRFERAFYDDVYGTDDAETDAAGRLVAPAARRPVNRDSVPARSADGMELSRAVARLAARVADIAETQGSRDAVRHLQRGLTVLSHAVTAARDGGRETPPLFADLADDGDPGPKTRAALRAAAARLGMPKVEEALALGRFEAALRDLTGGAPADGIGQAMAAAFAELFRDPDAGAPGGPTEEGESLQMAVNDLGPALLGPRGFAAIREDGIVGPKTEAALMRVLKAAGPRRLTEAMGRNLGFFLFDPPAAAGRGSLPRTGIAAPDLARREPDRRNP